MGVVPLASPPLVSLCPAYNYSSLHVRTRLDAPLVKKVDRRELLALVLAADAAAERAERVGGGAAGSQCGRSMARVEAACQLHRPGHHTALDTLAELGMLAFAPGLQRCLQTRAQEQQSQQQQQHARQQFAQQQHQPHFNHPQQPQRHPQQQQQQQQQQQPGAGYLAYVNLLNQVVTMSTQLYNDATTPAHHKYTAHQVALLYQSLNMLQGETKPIRRHIEARFDEIKGITESDRPVLALELSSWLQTVTWVCRQEVIVCPQYMHRRLTPLLQCAR